MNRFFILVYVFLLVQMPIYSMKRDHFFEYSEVQSLIFERMSKIDRQKLNHYALLIELYLTKERYSLQNREKEKIKKELIPKQMNCVNNILRSYEVTQDIDCNQLFYIKNMIDEFDSTTLSEKQNTARCSIVCLPRVLVLDALIQKAMFHSAFIEYKRVHDIDNLIYALFQNNYVINSYNGISINVDLKRNSFDPHYFDSQYGKNAAQQAIDSLKVTLQ